MRLRDIRRRKKELIAKSKRRERLFYLRSYKPIFLAEDPKFRAIVSDIVNSYGMLPLPLVSLFNQQ